MNGAALQQFEFRDAPFLGRGAEVRQLRDLWNGLKNGRGGVVFVEADSGTGKTRLLQEFSREIRGRIFWGQGQSRRAPQPLSLFEGVVEDLISSGEASPLHHMLRQSLLDRQNTIVSIFPSLKKVFPNAQVEKGGVEMAGQERTVRAFSHFLNALGSEDMPALVVLDDCQWGDDLSHRLISYWHSHVDPQTKVLLVAAYRTKELADQSPLRLIRPRGSVSLGPLASDSIKAILEEMAGPMSPAAIALVRRLSNDNPFMLTAAMRGLVEARALVQHNGVWELDVLEEQHFDDQDGLNFLRKRIELLPPSTIALLKSAAVIGKRFRLEDAAILSKLPAEDAATFLAETTKRHLVANADGNRFAFAHDKIRESLLSMLSEQEERSLHFAVAQLLVERSPHRSAEIAFHFHRAGKHDLALPYAVPAAQEARARQALELAEFNYRIAAQAATDAPGALRQKIMWGLGEVLMGRGKYDEADECLKKAYELSDDILDKGRISSGRSMLNTYRGNTAGALEASEQGLLLLGERIPQTALQQAMMLGSATFQQVLHALFPRFLVGRKEVTERELVILELLSSYSYPLYFECRAAECFITHMAALNRIEKCKPTSHLAHQYSAHCMACTTIPWFKRALQYGQKGLLLRQQLNNDEWGVGSAYHFYGVALLNGSLYREALENLLKASRIFERLGFRWDEDMVNCNIAYVFYRLGNLEEAAHIAERVYESGLEINDVQSVAPALSAWSKASGGAVPDEILARLERSARSFDLQTRVEMKQARAIWHLGQGNIEASRNALREAWHDFIAQGFSQEYVIATIPWLATVERVRLEQLGEHATRADWREAIRVAKAALHAAKKFKNNLPHALREMGILEALQMREGRARYYFDESLRVATEQGARYEHALTRHAVGRLGNQFGWDGVKEQLASAIRDLTQMKANMEFVALYPTGNNARPQKQPVTLVEASSAEA